MPAPDVVDILQKYKTLTGGLEPAQGEYGLDQARREVLTPPEEAPTIIPSTRAPKTYLGKILRGAEWALGGVSDITQRKLTIPVAQSVVNDDPIAKYRLEELRDSKEPIYGGDVLSAAGLLRPEESDPWYTKFAKGAGRFTASVAMDPLSYVSFGSLTKAGRAVKMAKAAIAEGREIEVGSKVYNLISETLGQDVLKPNPTEVQKIINQATMELSQTPPPVLRKIASEQKLADESIQAGVGAYFYPRSLKPDTKVEEALASISEPARSVVEQYGLGGKIISKGGLKADLGPKVFVGSEAHHTLITNLGYDPVASGEVKLNWAPVAPVGRSLAIPFHLPKAAKEELRGMLEDISTVHLGDQAGGLEATLKQVKEIADPIKSQIKTLTDEAVAQGLKPEEVPEIQKLNDSLVQLYKESKAKLRLDPEARYSTLQQSEGTGEALRAYELRKTQLLKQYPLTAKGLTNQIDKEGAKLGQLLTDMGRSDLKVHLGTGYSDDIIALRQANIPEVNEALDRIRKLSQLRDVARNRDAVINATGDLFLKTKPDPVAIKKASDDLITTIEKNLQRQKIKELPTAADKPLAEQIRSGERTLAQVNLPGGIEFPVPLVGKGKLAQTVADAFSAVNRIGFVNRIEKSFQRVFSTKIGQADYDKLADKYKSLARHRAGMELQDSVTHQKMLNSLSKRLNISKAQLERQIAQDVERATAGVPVRNLRNLIGPIAEVVESSRGRARKMVEEALKPITEAREYPEALKPPTTVETQKEARIIGGIRGPKPEPTINERELSGEPSRPEVQGSNWKANLDNIDLEKINTKSIHGWNQLTQLDEVINSRKEQLNLFLKNPAKTTYQLTESSLKSPSTGLKLKFPEGEQFQWIRGKTVAETRANIKLELANLEDLSAKVRDKLSEASDLWGSQGLLRTGPRTLISKETQPPVVDEVKKILSDAVNVSPAYDPTPTSRLIAEMKERKERIETELRVSGVHSVPVTTNPQWVHHMTTDETNQQIEEYLLKKGKLRPGFRPGEFRREKLRLMRENMVIVDPDEVDQLVHSGIVTEKTGATLKGKRGLEKLDQLLDARLITDTQYNKLVYTLGPQDANDLAAKGHFPWQNKADVGLQFNPQEQHINDIMSSYRTIVRARGEESPAALAFKQELDKYRITTQEAMKARAPTTGPVFLTDPVYSSGVRGVIGQQVLTAHQFYGELIQRQIGLRAEEAPKGWLGAPQPELQGYLFHPDIARALSKWQEISYNDKAIADFLRLFDSTQNAWKAWTLAIFPAYHTRNLVGHMWNNFLGGVFDPAIYGKAMDVAGGKEIGFKDGLGKVWKTPDLMEKFQELGLLSRGWYGSEITPHSIAKGLEVGSWMTPSYSNKMVQTGFKVGNWIENRVRIAHALSKMAEGMTPEDAVLSAKKYLFDYGDLTDFEKQTMKRFFPFYSWTRKNVPLQLQSLITQPAKFSVLYKGRRAVEQDTSAPNEKYLPQWVMENFPTRIRYNDKLKNYEYFVLNSWLPAMDIAKLLELHQTAVNMLTPIPKEILQQLFNYDYFLKRQIQTIPGQTDRLNIGPAHVDMPVRVLHGLKVIRLLNEIDKLSKPDSDFLGKISELATGKTYIYDEQKAKIANKKQTDDKIKALRSGLLHEALRPDPNQQQLNRIRQLIVETAKEY